VQQAESEARLALDNPATRPLGLALLGTIRLQEGKYDESTTYLTQALALNPRLRGRQNDPRKLLMLQGKPDSARKSFQKPCAWIRLTFNARLDLAKVEASLTTISNLSRSSPRSQINYATPTKAFYSWQRFTARSARKML